MVSIVRYHFFDINNDKNDHNVLKNKYNLSMSGGTEGPKDFTLSLERIIDSILPQLSHIGHFDINS